MSNLHKAVLSILLTTSLSFATSISTTEATYMDDNMQHVFNSAYTVEWSNSVKVLNTTNPPIKTLKDTYKVNETISVTVAQSQLTGADDRIGVFRKSDKQEWDWDVVRKWAWTPVHNTYKLTNGDKRLPAGEYEIRLYTDFSSHPMPKAKYSFRIGGSTNAPIKTLKKVYKVNETISVTVAQSQLTGADDRIGVFRKSDKQEWDWDVVRKWAWTPVHNTYKLTNGHKRLPAGEYEIRLYTDFSSHPMPKAKYSFRIRDNAVGGLKTPYIGQVKTYVSNNDRYIIHYADGHTHNAPIVFFLPGGGGSSMGHKGLMKFIASQGVIVIGANKESYYTSYKSANDAFKSALKYLKDTKHFTVDKSRLGVIGHSIGGGVTTRVLKEFKADGYGTKSSFIVSLDGWAAFRMHKADLRGLHTASLMIQFGGAVGIGTDPRFNLTISKLLPYDHEKGIVLIDSWNHSYSGGNWNATYKTKINLLKPIQNLIDYKFFAKKYLQDELFGNYFDTFNIIKKKMKKKYGEPCDGMNSYAQKKYQLFTKYNINYCSDYK